MAGPLSGKSIAFFAANEGVEQFRTSVADEYKNQTGITPQIYVTTASEGASEVAAEAGTA